jgi:hypothetical protein
MDYANSVVPSSYQADRLLYIITRVMLRSKSTRPMLNTTLQTLLHAKPFRRIVNLLEPLLISTELELRKLEKKGYTVC